MIGKIPGGSSEPVPDYVPPPPPSSSTQMGAPRLPFDLADVGIAIVGVLFVWLFGFVLGVLAGACAAGAVVAFRALT